MLSRFSRIIFFITIIGMLSSCQQQKEVDLPIDYVSLVKNDSLSKLDVYLDGKYFTSYLYADTLLRKPVLYPLRTAS